MTVIYVLTTVDDPDISSFGKVFGDWNKKIHYWVPEAHLRRTYG